MKVIICGAGQVGYNIGRYLAVAGNDVTVIDQRAELTEKIGESLDIQAITGHASHPDVLERAGAEDAEMLIAVTHHDEVNMVACQVAHSIFNVPIKIARIRQQSYLEGRWKNLFRREHLPIDFIISPEREIAKAIATRLEVPGAISVIPFADDRVRLISARCGENCPILDTPLRQLTFLFPDLHLVCVGITRDNHFFVPSGDDHLSMGDEVYSVVDASHVERAMRAFGHEDKVAERIIIAGAGNIGLFLAHEIEERWPNASLTLIEANQERARYVADQLPQHVVLHGDARDAEIHGEANLATADAIVGVTNDDEVNIMSALLAKRTGDLKALTLINNTAYSALLGRARDRRHDQSAGDDGLQRAAARPARAGSAPPTPFATARRRCSRRRSLETSSLVGLTIKEARLPAGVIVGAILRDGDDVVVPRGDTTIFTGDRVVIVARGALVKKAEKLFSVRIDYF